MSLGIFKKKSKREKDRLKKTIQLIDGIKNFKETSADYIYTSTSSWILGTQTVERKVVFYVPSKNTGVEDVRL